MNKKTVSLRFISIALILFVISLYTVVFTAAYTKKLAIAKDIQNDPKWIPYEAYIEKTR